MPDSITTTLLDFRRPLNDLHAELSAAVARYAIATRQRPHLAAAIGSAVLRDLAVNLHADAMNDAEAR